MACEDFDLSLYHSLTTRYPGQSLASLKMAMAEARKCPAYQNALRGNEALAVGEVLDFVSASDWGRVVSGRNTSVKELEDYSAKLAKMTPEQQMDFARKMGLK